MKTVQLEPRHLKIVKDILSKHNLSPFIFGSRAKNAAKLLSDLDICLKDDCDKSKLRALQDDFEESDLPFKVDVVVWSELSDGFKSQIEKDLLKLD